MKTTFLKEIKAGLSPLIIPIFKDKKFDLPKPFSKFLKEFKGKKNTSLNVIINEKSLPERIIFFGMGNFKNLNGEKARNMGGMIGKIIKKEKYEKFYIYGEGLNKYIYAFYEGLLFSQYKIDKFKSKKEKNPFEIKKITFISNKTPSQYKKRFERIENIALGMEYAKNLVNAPSNYVNQEYIIKEARAMARENNFKYAIFGEKELKKMKWGGVLAVNQGSQKSPYCVVFEYQGAKNKKEKPIALVGKGVVFDSGGYNLKPSGYIETMHQDMAGCAVLMGLFKIVKKLEIKKNIIGVIPLVENLIGGKAYRPSDIITMYSGNTVEITNTDAEGRLILADAITYAKEFKPESIITIATLTGAVSVALGNRYSGLIGNDTQLRRELSEAGKKVDDLGWGLPLHKDYKKIMESQTADFRNMDTGSARLAGASKAAAFLEKFVGKTPWCHIDVGGTAFTDDPKEYEQKGATAQGLRMLAKHLLKLNSPKAEKGKITNST